MKADASADPVMFLKFISDSMSMLEVTDYAERNLIDRLSTVPGVARVSINGGRRYSMRIWIDRQALAARQLTVTDIEDALRRENVELPAGRIESRTREFSLRTLVGLESEQDFRELVIARGAGRAARSPGRSGERAARRRERAHDSRFDGQRRRRRWRCEAQSKANTLDIVRGVRAEIERDAGQPAARLELDVGVDNARGDRSGAAGSDDRGRVRADRPCWR